MGAIVLHCVGMSLAKCSSFSSSTRVHSVFLIDGSSHSYQRALHCLADLRTSNEEHRAHWFFPYFITAALRISSSLFFHTPPFIMIRILDKRIMGRNCLLRNSRQQTPPPQPAHLTETEVRKTWLTYFFEKLADGFAGWTLNPGK